MVRGRVCIVAAVPERTHEIVGLGLLLSYGVVQVTDVALSLLGCRADGLGCLLCRLLGYAHPLTCTCRHLIDGRRQLLSHPGEAGIDVVQVAG